MFGVRMKYVVLLVAVLAAAGAAAFALTAGPFAPVQVRLAQATHATLKPSAFGIGTVEARLSYAVGPTQAGRLLSVRVDHGDRVAAGQVLAELEPVDLAERVAASEFALSRAHAAMRATEAQAREAASRHRVALANAARYRDLAKRGFVSTELADNRQNDADVTEAGLHGAQASVAAAGRDIERLARERDAIAKQLGNLKLVAPATGIVVARLAEPGTTLVAGQAVVRFVDPQSIWVRARIEHARAGSIRVGDVAEIVLRSAQEAKHAGRVARVELQSDAVTEERLVNVTFDEFPAGFSLGEPAEVRIRQAEINGALVVPTAAVSHASHRVGVWRIENGRTRFQPVRVGAQTLEGETQVLEGLQPGDDVIVHSAAQLKESIRVRAARPE
jgi:HlyD family secretion protein